MIFVLTSLPTLLLMHGTIAPYDSLADLHIAAADAFCQSVQQAVAERGTCKVSLSGGSTPRVLYEMLASRDLPWTDIHWFWGDERNVPAADAASNQRMVRQALLDHVPVPEANIHPVPVIVDDPSTAARRYEATIRQAFPETELPTWDLVLLGMGDDAHTASLFPGTEAIQTLDRLFVENWVEKFDSYRYTLTAPAINSGREIWFLVAGEAKQEALRHVLGLRRDPHRFPSQLVTPTRWFVTADAFPGGIS